jgi:hypothetical protein
MVLRMTVYVKMDFRVKLSDLNLDLSQYQKSNDPELRDIIYYKHEKRGVIYVVNEVKCLCLLHSVNR